MSMVSEFKEFIQKGNVVDMAVGVIIGAAFGKIVSSVVGDLLMPPIGLASGGMDFKNLKLVIGGTAEAPVSINYGNFIQTTIDFVIIAFCVFLLVKGVNALRKPAAAPADPGPTPDNPHFPALFPASGPALVFIHKSGERFLAWCIARVGRPWSRSDP